MRYFKKLRINVPFQLSNGTLFRFPQVDHDVGILATTDPFLLGEFDQAIRRQIGAVMEITEAEYNELVQKKTELGTLKPRWREELSNKMQVPQNQINQQTMESAPVAEVRVPMEMPPRPTARTK